MPPRSVYLYGAFTISINKHSPHSARCLYLHATLRSLYLAGLPADSCTLIVSPCGPRRVFLRASESLLGGFFWTIRIVFEKRIRFPYNLHGQVEYALDTSD